MSFSNCLANLENKNLVRGFYLTGSGLAVLEELPTLRALF
jgi:hypothetical protein